MNKICPLLSMGNMSNLMGYASCKPDCMFRANGGGCVLAKAAAIYVDEHTSMTAYEPEKKAENLCGFTF